MQIPIFKILFRFVDYTLCRREPDIRTLPNMAMQSEKKREIILMADHGFYKLFSV
jgi:hypothetical protein